MDLKRFNWRPPLMAPDRTIDLELGLRKFDAYRHLTLFSSNGDMKRLSTMLYDYICAYLHIAYAMQTAIYSFAASSNTSYFRRPGERASGPRLNTAVAVPCNNCLLDRLPFICIRTSGSAVLWR